MHRTAIVAAAFAVMLWAQTVSPRADDALVDVLLFASPGQIDLNVYPSDVRTELARYLARYRAYRSQRPRPAKAASVEGMVYDARVSYERRLAAASADPKAPALAAAYVDSLRPCYEWEDSHECPEREAIFAATYERAHPGGPLTAFLPLLAAHRWLCAAESYKSENRPEGAARSRKEYERAISNARASKSPLIRFAAERLSERNSCMGRP